MTKYPNLLELIKYYPCDKLTVCDRRIKRLHWRQCR